MGAAPNEAGGVLYVVATPIGNPEDITARAIRILKEADLIACEDTRRTARLLAQHSIATPTVSYFEHNEERRTPELVERIAAGGKIALVSDAGTPTISDPGYRLVHAALEHGLRVVAVPGGSAVIAALSVAGLPTNRFAFEGFPPAKSSARRNLLERVARDDRTLVFFEAARRLPATLADMAAVLGGKREAAVVREITKAYEQTVRGTLDELAARYCKEAPLGEVTLVVAGAAAASNSETPGRVFQESHIVDVLREAGLSLKQASAAAAKLTQRSRRQIYQDALLRRRTT